MNPINPIRPDAPELTAQGDYDIGVRTIDLIDAGRVDVLNTVNGGENAIYDRPLTVEVWYPANVPASTDPTPYTIGTMDTDIDATLIGRAVRDAIPNTENGPYPLVVISHGYPGNRYLLGHLGENLATKGYITVSIDHTDSTYDNQATFSSTLLNRSLDQLFVIDAIDTLSNPDSNSFLSGIVDADNTGIIGFSMGGYGAINVIGGGYTAISAGYDIAPPNRLLSTRGAGNPDYKTTIDPRVKAAIAIGPWGMNFRFWDDTGLAGIKTPLMVIAGSVDDVSGYENGPRAIWQGAVNTERYLLTFENANHNAGAPMPVPQELLAADSEFYHHYLDPVWDAARMNNITQHFATAYFGLHLKRDTDMTRYLDLVENAGDGVYAVDDGAFTEKHTYWAGFPDRTAAGLRFERMGVGEN